MPKKYRSIDGFILKPSSSSLNGNVRTKAPISRGTTINDNNSKSHINKITIDKFDEKLPNTFEQSKPVKSDRSLDDDLLKDIENSLNDIEDSNSNLNSDLEQKKRHFKKPRKPLAPKKRFNFKKFFKRLLIFLLLAGLVAGGYLAYKALLAGGKVFKGNPLDALTTRAKLDEDKNGRTNILIFGTSGYSMSEDAWDGALLTDSIMVLSIDQKNHNAYMISLPRDLYVKHSCPAVFNTTAGKLNETFYCKYSENKKEEEGAKALMKQAGNILGIDMHYYIHADWTALVQAVNAVGGVNVKIESDDPRGIYDSSTNLRYRQGEIAHLDGEKALALSRARNHNYGDYGLAGGNYDREKNQQKILASLQHKALSAGTLLNITALDKLIDSMGNNMVTNFQSSHMQTLLDIASHIKSDQIKQLPFVGRPDGEPDLIAGYSSDGQYLGEAPVAGLFDYSEIQEYIAKNLSNDASIKEGAKLDVLNGSDKAGLAKVKAAELEANGFKINNIDNSPTNIAEPVVIYQINEKPATAKKLQELYKVKPIKSNLEGYQTEADFVVAFGESSDN